MKPVIKKCLSMIWKNIVPLLTLLVLLDIRTGMLNDLFGTMSVRANGGSVYVKAPWDGFPVSIRNMSDVEGAIQRVTANVRVVNLPEFPIYVNGRGEKGIGIFEQGVPTVQFTTLSALDVNVVNEPDVNVVNKPGMSVLGGGAIPVNVTNMPSMPGAFGPISVNVGNWPIRW